MFQNHQIRLGDYIKFIDINKLHFSTYRNCNPTEIFSKPHFVIHSDFLRIQCKTEIEKTFERNIISEIYDETMEKTYHVQPQICNVVYIFELNENQSVIDAAYLNLRFLMNDPLYDQRDHSERGTTVNEDYIKNIILDLPSYEAQCTIVKLIEEHKNKKIQVLKELNEKQAQIVKEYDDKYLQLLQLVK